MTGRNETGRNETGRILLVGMMGAGKTTAGRLVAEKLGWDYLDSDVEVERKTGLTVPALFARDGEVAFRDAETEVLRDACARTGSVVISVAGGAVLRPENRALLRASGRVIWLRARPATLAVRVGDGAGRPLLEGDPGAALLALDAVRRPLYHEVADETIDVDDRNAAEVAALVIDGGWAAR
jgi:shikimate kinase/3-dehydroquinate synthase